jgi:hypothetical protein
MGSNGVRSRLNRRCIERDKSTLDSCCITSCGLRVAGLQKKHPFPFDTPQCHLKHHGLVSLHGLHHLLRMIGRLGHVAPVFFDLSIRSDPNHGSDHAHSERTFLQNPSCVRSRVSKASRLNSSKENSKASITSHRFHTL